MFGDGFSTLPSTRDARVGQILDELCRRRGRGERVDDAAVLAEHPDLADELRPHLALLHSLHGLRAPGQDLVAAGVLPGGHGTTGGWLGPYRVDGVRGGGGMGIVLKAYDESLSRPVALKILRADLAADAAALARFKREAQAAAALHHPNIVGVYAIGEERGLHYIAMEYVDGPSLAEIIRPGEHRRPAGIDEQRRPAGIDEQRRPAGRETSAEPNTGETPTLPGHLIRHIFRELLSGLDAAHRAGLIHRDVKPSNILLDLRSSDVAAELPLGRATSATPSADQEVGRYASCLRASVPSCLPLVKLADFGLARMRASQTQVTLTGSVLGTPEYMSPEQARGDADIDHRTDLYSAGVVLYEMLTGQTPFRCDTPTATIHRILHEEPADPRKLDKKADPVLASLAVRLMAKRPEDRFGSAADTTAALDARESVRPADRQPRRRLRLAVSVLVLVLLLFAAWLAHRLWVQMPASTWRGQTAGRARRIEKVEISDDREAILAYYDAKPEGEVFHRFPRPLKAIEAGAALADIDGRGQQLVVAALGHPPLDAAGSVLIAFDTDGAERWPLSLRPSGPDEPAHWPNCEEAGAPDWHCAWVQAANLDGEAGDELIAGGQHARDYPARISIVDPRAGKCKATFWHMGHTHGAIMHDTLLPGGKPALIVWGVNNKLDGFDKDKEELILDWQPGDDKPVTNWNIVPVVMILDPANMDRGLGPPRTARPRLPHDPSVLPYAYAWLDASIADVVEARGQPTPGPMGVEASDQAPPERVPPLAEQVMRVSAVEVMGWSGDPNDPWLGVTVERYSTVRGGALLLVDRKLVIHEVSPDGDEELGKTLSYWQARWHPLIQDGEYVSGLTTMPCSAAKEQAGTAP